MGNITAFISKNAVLIAIIAGALLGGVGLVWYQNGNGTEELLTVYRGPFTQQVSISGRVQAVDDVSLGFIQGGRVTDVAVSVGDQVRRGELLAQVENDDVRALVLQRRAALAAEEATLQDLMDGTRPEEIAVSEAAVASAEVVLEQAEQSLVEAIQDAFRAGDDAVRVQVDQFISNTPTNPQLSFTTAASAAKTTVEVERVSLEEVLTDWETVVFSLTVSGDVDTALTTAKNNLGRIAAFLTAANTAVNQGIPTGSVTQSILDGYASDVAAARSSVNTANTALTTAETTKKSAVTSLVSAEKSLALKEAGATAASIAAQEAKVDAARAQVLDAEAQLNKTFITAPFDGVVTVVDVEVGEVVTAHAPVISIISEDVLEIVSFVPEINVALLAVGNEARVTLDAYGEGTVFPARVVAIDPAETIRDGVSTYRALLEFDEYDARVRAGMTANIVVTTSEKENVIAVPQGVVVTQGGKKFVPVKVGDERELREVTTGLVSSFGTIEIISGLSEGDVVILAE